MKAIHFFGRKYTGTGRLAEGAASALNCRVLYDEDLIDKAHRDYGVKKSEIENALYNAPVSTDQFPVKKARALAAVRMTLAKKLATESRPVVLCGYLGALIPSGLGLHLLSTSSAEYRLKTDG